jgi:hypothetical protein
MKWGTCCVGLYIVVAYHRIVFYIYIGKETKREFIGSRHYFEFFACLQDKPSLSFSYCDIEHLPRTINAYEDVQGIESYGPVRSFIFTTEPLLLDTALRQLKLVNTLTLFLVWFL